MFTVVNHFETGQEYMSRYIAVDTEADTRGWQPRLRLKGIDVTVYAHQLFRALATIARELERTGDEAEWHSLATRSGDAITRHMWSPDARLFTDVDGRTLAPGDADALTRTGVKAAVGLLPHADRPGRRRPSRGLDGPPRGSAHLRHPLPPALVERGRPPLLGRGHLARQAAQLPLERPRLAHDHKPRHRGAAALPSPGPRAGGCARPRTCSSGLSA